MLRKKPQLSSWASIVIMLLIILPQTGVAQEAWSETDAGSDVESENTEDLKCTPPCRTGYLCVEAKCISLCNPPCDNNEKCTSEGECITKSTTLEVETTPAEPPAPKESINGATLDQLFEVDQKKSVVVDERPKVPTGFVMSFGGGPMLCGTSNACRTVKNGDLGVGINMLIGYRLLPWLLIDGGAAYSFLFLKDLDDSPESISVARKELFYSAILNLHLGARFYILKRKHIVEPVLGVHFGYAAMHRISRVPDGETGEKTKVRDNLSGLGTDATVGVDIRASDKFSIGVHVTVYKPFYTLQCIDNLDPKCAAWDSDSNDFFFWGLDLTGTFFL